MLALGSYLAVDPPVIVAVTLHDSQATASPAPVYVRVADWIESLVKSGELQ
jgi:hypothetical protein